MSSPSKNNNKKNNQKAPVYYTQAGSPGSLSSYHVGGQHVHTYGTPMHGYPVGVHVSTAVSGFQQRAVPAAAVHGVPYTSSGHTGVHYQQPSWATSLAPSSSSSSSSISSSVVHHHQPQAHYRAISAAPVAKKLKLTYFNGRGRAELARLVAALGNIQYEDVRVDFKEWADLKEKQPFQQLPVLTLPCGKQLPQGSTIARYFARKANMLGDSLEQEATHCALQEGADDAVKDYHDAFWNKDADKKKELTKAYFKDTLPRWTVNFERLLKANGGTWFVGSRIGFADLAVFDRFGAMAELSPNSFDDAPLLSAHLARVGAIPAIKAWVDKRPKTDF